ncbi:c-type cytochrome [Nitrincola sp. MINF-07-Sa-05]|uniref:c-type cytochrome n=1 Tax=Nitrincola salilacus TaxID=3400273 RepID=UPI003917F5D8
MNRLFLFVPLFCLFSLSLQARELIKPEDAVEYRQAAFQVMRFQFGAMAQMIRGEREFTNAEFLQRSQALHTLIPLAHEGFIDTTQNESTSRAADRLWDERERFDQIMARFKSDTAELVDVAAEGSQRQVRDQFRQAMRHCKACHDQYRLD